MNTVRKALLSCGVISSLVYVAMDALSSLRYQGYSYRDQAVSELNASGAPTRRLFVRLSVPYNLLLSGCSLGVWASADRKRAARMTGTMLAASAMVGQLTPLYFPMDRRGAEATRTGTMHGPMTAVGSLLILLAMGFGAGLHGGQFRRYSYATIAILVVAGGLTALYIPRVAADRPTPWMGIVERINIYSYLLWVAALAASLWRDDNA